jgi:hypothetical protein
MANRGMTSAFATKPMHVPTAPAYGAVYQQHATALRGVGHEEQLGFEEDDLDDDDL